MPIEFACECGKKVKAPDTLLGKKVRCPYCQNVTTVPNPVLDAEEVPPPAPPAPELAGYQLQADDDLDESDLADDKPLSDENRRPCPMCGEMIVATAVKCRFCGEVFDAALRSTLKADPELLRQFRREVHGVGGAWIFFGCICILFAFAMPATMRNQQNDAQASVMMVVFLVIACIWLISGIFSCLKHLWAMYFGLVFSYLSGLGSLTSLGEGKGPNVCGIVIIAAIIVQAHKAISKAHQLKQARVPLTARPESLRRH